MKIYSDILTRSDLLKTARQVRGGLFVDSVEAIAKPRVRKHGWVVKTSGATNHWKNSGTSGPSHKHAASFDQHGEWFALLYQLDPCAQIVH